MQVGGVTFNVGSRYSIQKLVGSGAYGQVVVAQDTQKKLKVAVKKLNKIDDEIDAKRVLREIKIQRALNHPNVLKVFNILYDNTITSHHFGDVYIVSQFYPADLSKIIKSGQELSVAHLQYIMYQLVKGVHYLHSAQVIHRDIKPGNILATENCEICLCDFGFARKFEPQDIQKEELQMTEYVVTRYYRAPEIMLSSSQYTKAVDIWSLGCTFAELITGKVLFKGANYIQMVKLIFDVLGLPKVNDLAEFVTNENAQGFVQSLPAKPRRHISETIKYSNEQALDLLNKMLEPKPSARITSEQCLAHPFFASIRDKKEETVFDSQIKCDFELEEEIQLESLKELIITEINHFNVENKQPMIDVQNELKRLRQVQEVLLEEKRKSKLKAQK